MQPDAKALIDDLEDARARTLSLVGDLGDEQLAAPMLAIVNLPRWEIGHVAWFQEKWTLRHLARRESMLDDADDQYDSAAVLHDDRWSLPLPSRERTLAYMQDVLAAVIERLRDHTLDATERYFHRLVLFHEDMHGEALAYTRQTLSYAAPADVARVGAAGIDGTGGIGGRAGPLSGDAAIPGARFPLGAERSAPFVFDNEKWSNPVDVPPFRIARAVVTQAEFAEFVEDGGYSRDEHWIDAGLRWRETARAEHPVYWRRASGGGWMRRHYDKLVPLEEHRPVLHVNWFEADAFCRWAGRRLPTEAEWELAASGEPSSLANGVMKAKRLFPWGDEPPSPARAQLDLCDDGCSDAGAHPLGDSAFGCRQMIGNVWEWTSSDFLPYPGFVIDPYEEYSQPWFGTHKVLRGGCFATRSRLIRNTWRNFYTPDRRDVLAGFRTVAS